MSEMEFGPIPPSKYDEVIQHLRETFFCDEPLNKSMALCAKGHSNLELERHSLATLKDGLSVMAVEKTTGALAGVALNGIARFRDFEQCEEKLRTTKDDKFRKIFHFLNKANKELDLFAKYGVDEIFEHRILSVSLGFRGIGLAKQLMVRSEIIAEESGYKVFKVDATSAFTARCCNSLQLETVGEVLYSTYTENGKPIFNTLPPHDRIKVMVKIFN